MSLGWHPDQNWSLLTLTGSDRNDFFSRLSTNTLPKEPGALVHSFFLTVQAKVLSEFWVGSAQDALYLLTPNAQLEAAHKNIDQYHFGEKIELHKPNGLLFILEGEGSLGTPLHDHVAHLWEDPRHLGCRWVFVEAEHVDPFLSALEAQERVLWDHLDTEQRRIPTGRPRLGVDYDESSLFLEFAQKGDFSETKGCYPGQEIVARVLHRGKLNKHLRGFDSQDVVPQGMVFQHDSKEVARTFSSVEKAGGGSFGYLLVRRAMQDEGTQIQGQTESGQEVTVTVTSRAQEILTGDEVE